MRDLSPEVLGGQNPERVHAALVVRTAGDWHAFQDNVVLAEIDWRDALVRADLADANWPYRLDAILGTG